MPLLAWKPPCLRTDPVCLLSLTHFASFSSEKSPFSIGWFKFHFGCHPDATLLHNIKVRFHQTKLLSRSKTQLKHQLYLTQIPNKRNKQRMSHNTKLKIGIDKKAIAKRKYFRHHRGESSKQYITALLWSNEEPETAPPFYLLLIRHQTNNRFKNILFDMTIFLSFLFTIKKT